MPWGSMELASQSITNLLASWLAGKLASCWHCRAMWPIRKPGSRAGPSTQLPDWPGSQAALQSHKEAWSQLCDCPSYLGMPASVLGIGMYWKKYQCSNSISQNWYRCITNPLLVLFPLPLGESTCRCIGRVCTILPSLKAWCLLSPM